MSLQTRQGVANLLTFNDEQARLDLLDPEVTNTWLIALLADVIERSLHPLLVTAVCRDHSNDGSGHSHHEGWAVDLWHANWMTIGDERILDVLIACADSPYVWTIGLGGKAQQYFSAVSRACHDRRQVVFMDDGEDHVHLQAGNTAGEGML